MAQRSRQAAQDALVSALAMGANVEHAARRAGLSERTVYRYLADPAFRQQVTQKRAELLQRIFGMLAGAGLGSVKTLVDLQQDAAVPAGVRRGAARDVLALGLRYGDCTDFEQRLAAIEEQVQRTPADDPAAIPGAKAATSSN